MCAPTLNSEEPYFGFEIFVSFYGTLDDDGYPVLQDVQDATGSFILRRYTNVGGFAMTDYASGDVTLSLTGTADLEFAD